MLKTLTICASIIAAPACAQQCAGYADVANGLSNRFQEELAVRGKNPDGTVSEIWGNSATGSWTYIVVTPNGVACLIASGSEFKRHSAKPNA